VLAVRWTNQAKNDLIEIIDYIAVRNPIAAQQMHERIIAGVELLSSMPYLFRIGRKLGTREYVAHPNYIVVYVVERDAIKIARVLHAKQEYPKN
jgi:toxin ParE1/3/4